MAQTIAQSASSLRALTYRISSTAPQQLPKIAPHIAGAIWNCRDVLVSPADSKQNDASALVHRFKTQLSSLLQERTFEGRWAGIVLVKAAIEAGGLEIVRNCNSWVRALLSILKKPEPPTTHCLAVITLTRIFMLTWHHSNLIREITTPALTTFVPACLANIEKKSCSASELQTILESFTTLIAKHPTIFRSNESKLRFYLVNIISSTSADQDSNIHYTKSHRASAQQLLALLHNCAPKQGANEKWDDTVKAIITAAHATCDQLFRAVHEDWQSKANNSPSQPSHVLLNGNLGHNSDDAVGLKAWNGVYAGGERLISLLDMTKSHVESTTSGVVSVRLGLLMNLLSRLFAVTASRSGKEEHVKINGQVSKDEREAMFSVLPMVHEAAIQVGIAILNRFGTRSMSLIQSLLDNTARVFRAEQSDACIRQVFYKLVSKIIDLIGPSLLKSEILELETVLRAACQDVVSVDGITMDSMSIGASAGIKQQSGLVDSEVVSSLTSWPDLQGAARNLLYTALKRLDAANIVPKLRTQIDRAAVISRDKHMMFASVMNPVKKQNVARSQPSLLPILAQEFGKTPEVESLLRPRLPPIFSGARRGLNSGKENEPDEVDYEDVVESGKEEDDSEPISGDPSAAIVTETLNGKRQADENVGGQTSAKRLRAYPGAERLLLDNTQLFSETDLTTEHTNAAETAESTEEVIAKPLTTAPRRSDVTAVVHSSASTLQNGHEDGDNSDFEMPPLTMESDTDPEEA